MESGEVFTRDDERLMNELQAMVEAGKVLDGTQMDQLAVVKMKYHNFLEEGEGRLREGRLRLTAASSPARRRSSNRTCGEVSPNRRRPSGEISTPLPEKATSGAAAAAAAAGDGAEAETNGAGEEVTGYVHTSLETASKAAYFWGSLVATAVPGYLGRKAGLVTKFDHWDFITDQLILGALPVVTQIGSSGNHLSQLRDQLKARQLRPLGLVVACLEEEEMRGFGVGMITFAQESHWREEVDPLIEYIRLPMPDTSAQVSVHAVANAVDRIRVCIVERQRAVYVHCKAGKGRSWMVVMCYLTTCGGMTFDEAESLVRSRRFQVNPSAAQVGFVRAFAAISPAAAPTAAGHTE